MVLAEKSSDDHRSDRRLRTASPNGHLSDDSSATDDSDPDNGMRVGEDYQAVVPELISASDPCPENAPEKALLVWSPCPEIPAGKLDEYVMISKEKYGYNVEQALGMLFWHKFDLEKALADLPNFTPFPDEWSVEDKVLFEQAFQFHGKSFHRIRQMLPDKSISSLVKYYYSWKKTRCRTSLMDRHARKLASQREDGSDAGSEAASENDSDMESENKDHKEDGSKSNCSNCNAPILQTFSTPKGSVCNNCFCYWRRTGMMRNSSGPMRKHESTSARHNPMKSKRKPPRGMHLAHEDLLPIATGPAGQGDAILKSMDAEVVSLKRQVQNNKQMIGQLKHKTVSGIEQFQPPETNSRMNARWTNDELLLAVQGLRKYGRDFRAIAEVIANKTEAHLRSFFTNYRRRYQLDAVLKEYEAEHGIEDIDQEDSMDTLDANTNAGSPAPEKKAASVTATSTSTTNSSPVRSNSSSITSGNNYKLHPTWQQKQPQQQSVR